MANSVLSFSMLSSEAIKNQRYRRLEVLLIERRRGEALSTHPQRATHLHGLKENPYPESKEQHHQHPPRRRGLEPVCRPIRGEQTPFGRPCRATAASQDPGR